MLHRHAGPAVAGGYTAGAIAGATLTTAVLFVISGLLSPLPRTVAATLAIAILVLLLGRSLGLVCLELPQRANQISREIFHARPPVAAFRFAAELGTGARTYITSTAPYAAVVLVLLGLPDGLGPAALAAAAVAIGYGIGRALVIALQSIQRGIAITHPPSWLRAADLLAVSLALTLAIGPVLGG